jgi:large subunit ribosomal protein L6
MSRIGNLPIPVPKGVDVTVDKNEVRVKGPKGSLSFVIPTRVSVVREGDELKVARHGDDSQAKAFHGLTQRMLSNLVTGVTAGFKKELELAGVGYRAALDGGQLNLNLGFSHPVTFKAPPGITIEVPKQTTIVISGHDKQQVGQIAAIIRGFRPPEPYKGKGIRYSDEKIRRKAGKKATK